MADKLSVTIALEGGKEIQKQLADIGTAGQKAFLDISKAAEKAGGFKNLKPEEVTAKLKEMGIVGEDAINKINKALATAVRTEQLVGAVKTVEQSFAGLDNTISGVIGAVKGIGATFAGLAVVKEVIEPILHALGGMTEAINQVDKAAARAGLSLDKFRGLQAALGKGGVSGAGTADAIQKITAAGEKAKIDQVTAAAKQLQEVMARGSDVRTSPALQQLLTMAQGFGPVADAAKKALADLNIQFTESEKRLQEMASSGTKSLEQLAAGFNGPVVEGRAWVQTVNDIRNGSDRAEATLQAFIVQLEAIKDPAERNKVAFQQMGEAGLEISRGIQTGAISSKQSVEELSADITKLTQAHVDLAASMEQSSNRGAAALQRYKETGDITEVATAIEEVAKRIGIAFSTMGNEIEIAIAKFQQWGGMNMPGYTSGIPPDTSGGGHAGGGLIGGLGTGISDSNLAWVSRGEHIMPARVVSQPGVLGLLEGLRLGGIGRFATGGVVSMPALAGGGGIGHLGTVDLRTDLGSVTMMASQSAVDQLSRLAVTKRMTSTGRKPGFVS